MVDEAIVGAVEDFKQEETETETKIEILDDCRIALDEIIVKVLSETGVNVIESECQLVLYSLVEQIENNINTEPGRLMTYYYAIYEENSIVRDLRLVPSL